MSDSPDMDEIFVQLIVSHQTALHAFVLALLPASPEVDDVVQEVNAMLWKKRSEFMKGTHFKAWMFSIAKFKVMAVWRDQKRSKVWTVPEETLHLLIEDASDACPETDDLRHQALRQCIEELPPNDRGLILKRYYESNSLKQLASEIGRKAENLKGSIHRIRLALRACVLRKTGFRRAMS